MQFKVDGVLHLYFGDGRKHPIVGNYIRCLPELPQEILLKDPSDGKVRRLIQVCCLLLRRRKHANLALHCHDFISGFLGGMLWQGRVIYDSHEIYASFARSRPTQCLISRMEQYAIARADIVVFPSRYRSDYYDLTNRDVRIVENLFYPYESSESANTRDFGDDRFFVYTGHFSEARAIEEIVAAFRTDALAQEKLILAGRLTRYFDSILCDLPSNVEYIGELDHEDVAALVQSAKAGFALYHPVDENNRRCAPTKIFEFLFHGVTAIANRSPYIDEIRARPGGGRIRAIDEISVSEIVNACLSVGEVDGVDDGASRSWASWQSQVAVVTSLYS